MNKVKYITRVLSGVTPKKMLDCVDKCHEKSGQSKVKLFFDMINCGIRYGAGYYDYKIFAFYDLNKDQRKTYVTRYINKKIIALLNNDEYSYIFHHKNVFNKHFAKYLKRGFLDVSVMTLDEFTQFINGKESIFAKPNTGDSGKGIEKLKVKDYVDAREMFDYIKGKDFGVVEEVITQHEDCARLYPLSVNTLRVVTMVVDEKPHCVYVAGKTGNGGSVVDNPSSGGMSFPVNKETGKIYSVAYDSKLNTFESHPYSGIKFDGYQLPFVDEAIRLCFQAAMETDKTKFVGWDVCITPTGPAIIEGNDYPGYDFWQLPEHTPEKIGLLPYYKQLLPNL